MLVKNWMSVNVITVDENEPMSEATRLMKENDIRMLPVLKKDKLTGIITDRDLKRASASDATSLEIHELLYLLINIKIKSIMTKNPITVLPDLTVEETAEILLENKISGAPVVDDKGKVVGVITQTDIFKILISLTGVGKRGIQFAFQVENRPGSIREVADVIRNHGGRMASILSSYDNVSKGYRKVYIRMYDIDRHKLQKLQDDLRNTAELLYFADHRENLPKTYQE
jgi:acetoin utilization protein AcuB